MEDLFKKARKYITPGLICQYAPASTDSMIVVSGEFSGYLKTLNPSRVDRTANSFYIHPDTGKWKEFSGDESGDLFDLIAKIEGISTAEVAKNILKNNGEWQEKPVIKKTKEKPPAGVIDAKAWAELKIKRTEDYYIEKHGEYETGWPYRGIDGQYEYVQIRYVKPPLPGSNKKRKTDIPFYYTINGSWKNALPPGYETKKLPLYNIHLLTPTTKKVLLVEGCKCGDVKISGWLVLSWGGCSQVNIRRWQPLIDRKDIKVVIWPDRDLKPEKTINQQPGMKAALTIQKKYLPWAEILDVYDFFEDSGCLDGWDIADAEEENLNLKEILLVCPKYSEKIAEVRGTETTTPFKFLGYNQEYYYYIPDGAPYPYKIRQGRITKIQLMNIAPLAWWMIKFPAQKTADWDAAFDWLIRESQSKGWYDAEILRSSGFWKDGENYYCNTGRELLTPGGQTVAYKNAESEYSYIQSGVYAKCMLRDKIASDVQGKTLRELFEVQGFETRLQAWEMLGWVLMSPFGGLLTWRPSCWLTGKTGSGKSHMLSNLIIPLAGEFAYTGSGENTVANVKRESGTNSRAVFLDEMEGRNAKNWNAIRKITGIIELARNAASDSSNRIKQMGADGTTETFVIRSCFCLTSIVPAMSGAAIENRFLVPTLDGRVPISQKREKGWPLIQTGVLQDPTIFLRRNWKNIDQILKNIEWLKEVLGKFISDQRKIDNYSPIFAFIFALENEGEITKEFCATIAEMLKEVRDKEILSDEEILIDEIMSSRIRIEGNQERTIYELILSAIGGAEISDIDNKHLVRNGIWYNKHLEYVAISNDNKYIREMLKETDYALNYGRVLRRHKLAITNKLTQVRMGGGKNIRCVLFTRDNILKIIEGE